MDKSLLFFNSLFQTSITLPLVSKTFPSLAVANLVVAECFPAQEVNFSPSCLVEPYNVDASPTITKPITIIIIAKI